MASHSGKTARDSTAKQRTLPVTRQPDEHVQPESRGLTTRDVLQLQRQIGNQAVVRMLAPVVQRYIRIDTGSQTYPIRKEARTFLSDKTVTGEDNEFFISQEKRQNSWYNEKGGANLSYKSTANLLVAADLDLAIEAGVEAKVFFATKARIEESNTILENIKSPIRMQPTSRYLEISDKNRVYMLFQIEPKRLNKQKGVGLKVTVPQNCNQMAELVTKRSGLASDAHPQALLIAANLMDTLTGGVYKYLTVAKSIVEGEKNQNKLEESLKRLDEMAVDFLRMYKESPEKINHLLREQQVNQFLAPKIGDVLVTRSLATDEEKQKDSFDYHFGTVIARSGGDYITMENYARREKGHEGTSSEGDPLFFFKMYGTEQAEQTWHNQQLATGAFVGMTLSFIVR